MSELQVMKDMLRLSRDIINHYDKEEAIEVLDGLDKWIVGDVSVIELRRIAINKVVNRSQLDTSYDSEITANLANIYANAASRGQYNLSLIESAIKAGRKYPIVQVLSKFDRDTKEYVDITNYVPDEKWTDEWIVHILRNYSKINKCGADGYDVMAIFTPKHNPNIFDMVCSRLSDDNIRFIIPTDWIKNTNYSSFHVSHLIDLYHENPHFEWACMITPDVCGFAVQEISDYTERDLSKEDIKKILEYWGNVTPKLEYCIMDGNQGISLMRKKEIYNSCKSRYGCDGDELADKLVINSYPERVLRASEYWHTVHGNRTDNQFLSALRAMQGGM